MWKLKVSAKYDWEITLSFLGILNNRPNNYHSYPFRQQSTEVFPWVCVAETETGKFCQLWKQCSVFVRTWVSNHNRQAVETVLTFNRTHRWQLGSVLCWLWDLFASNRHTNAPATHFNSITLIIINKTTYFKGILCLPLTDESCVWLMICS